MPSSKHGPGGAPPSTCLTPTSENRGIPQWKMQQQQQQQPIMPSRYRNGVGRRQVRPLTVDEALQYSAFSSTVPHNPDIVPPPSIGLPGCLSVTSALNNRSVSRPSLELLDEEVLSSNGSSALLNQAVMKIQSYLAPEELTEFKFKTFAGTSNHGRQAPATSGSAAHHKPTSILSPFAEMIFNSTDIAYRYPTPDTPGARSTKGVHSPKYTPKEPPLTPIGSQHKAGNYPAHASNEAIHVQSSGIPTPAQKLSTPVVAIPLPPPSFRHSDYITFPDVDITKGKGQDVNNVSRKRKHDVLERDDGPPSRIHDQSQKSDESLRSLQNLVGDIFEAEDQLQPDTSGTTSLDASKYFVLTNAAGDGGGPTLAPWVYSKLEIFLQKVISIERFAEIPVEHLSRLQKLCEGELSLAEATKLTIEASWGENDVECWRQRVEAAETGLRSARTLLRIMIGGREEKQLYSEEMLRSVLNVLKHIMDSCIVPVVEARSIGSSSEIFATASSQQKLLSTLTHQASRVMRSLAELLVKVEVAEGAITTIEFLVARLVFVENAHSEKESALGIQKFEALRRNATDVLARVFAKYEDQRECIVLEILTSLEKLPQTRQSARQFKLIDGKNIQLVSALIMQLVQSSGAPSDERNSSTQKTVLPTRDTASDLEADESDHSGDNNEGPSKVVNRSVDDTDTTPERHPVAAVQRLAAVAQPLFDSASRIADYIIKFFVQRALTSTKTGDQPYRNLLDIFTEDLLNVLGSTDWPAAELLLRCLLLRTIGIAESGSSTAPAKNMALELLGMMGSAISDVAAYVRQLAKSMDHTDSDLSGSLVQLSEEYFDGKLQGRDLFTWDGPYRVTLQYLQARDLDDSQIRSARGFYLTQWALADGLKQISERAELPDAPWDGLMYLYSGSEPISTNQARLGYGLTVLNVGFCKAFERILKILLESMSSEQATLRNRSLKSVVHMLEKDPTILDRGAYVIRLIVKCASDPSPMVRDSALALMGKCMLIKPALEDDMCRSILGCTGDPAIGVRKRSMRLLKDIYLRNSRKDVKAVIADSLLQRAQDSDESVSDLARQMFQEVWFHPFCKLAVAGEDSVTDKLALKEQVTLVIRTVKRGERVVSVLDSLLQSVLSNDSRNGPANFRVCKAMVAVMFDGIIHQEELPQGPEQQPILQTLTIFAKAKAKLFTAEQLQFLRPYVENLSSADDLLLFRAVVVIFRYVLPHLYIPQTGFLGEVQTALLKSLPRLAEAELNEVVPCLWTISNVLKNGGKLVRTATSIFARIPRAQDATPADKDQRTALMRVKNYMRIAGYIGKYWDLENEQKAFQDHFHGWSGDSVSGLMVDLITPYTDPEQPNWMRAMALESVGLICQTWPQHFIKAQINNAFTKVFEEGNAEFQNIVLLCFKDFFACQERRSERKTDPPDADRPDLEPGRLVGPMSTSDIDGASALIAQQFLRQVLHVALASQDAYALTATEVLTTINRQGLVHPKECGPALVALETSTNRLIAEIAFKEHRNLHQQHESMFEKEYMKAVQEAFTYQRDVVRDPRGATVKPYASKLRPLFEIIKMSKGKYQKKFLSNLCTKVDFDPAKLDVSAEPPTHLQCAMFVVENLIFFEYGRVDELLYTISCMGNVVTGTGAVVAHAIKTELFKVKIEPNGVEVPHIPEQPPATNKPVDLKRLKQLATASMILSIMWAARSFLRRLFGLNPNQQHRDDKAKATAKDLNKAPTRVHGVTGDRLWAQISETMTGLSSHEAMTQQCQQFLELLTIDDEPKVPEDDASGDLWSLDTPSIDQDGDLQMLQSRDPKAVRRKNSISVSETPKRSKKRGRPSLGGRKKSRASPKEEEDWQ
ncbi:MAG: Sister chromatid cohesion protein 2 [Pleopsidium flavum]|nr:MAG: Sister chromatid cohesion protein 2 [Pleopsidium flavum]